MPLWYYSTHISSTRCCNGENWEKCPRRKQAYYRYSLLLIRFGSQGDRTAISSNINDLAYIKVEMVDKDGVVVPVSGMSIRFSIEGSGELAAAGNGNPVDMQSFRNHTTTTLNGKCLTIVHPNGKKGIVKLKTEADGFESSLVEIDCK